MLGENELLFDELYEKTKDFGRTQFVRLLMAKERENKELKIQVSSREEVANKYKEVIDKATNDLNIIIDIVREQPLGSDCWIIDRLEANKSILKEAE